MKITVIGTGYVGLSTGVCLSEIGHHVTCMDVDEKKINLLRQGISPIYEPGLDQLITKNTTSGNLLFTTSHQEGLKNAEIIIISVGTPQKDNGAADLSYLIQAAKDISTNLDHDAIIILKSTVPVGTNDYLKNIFQEYARKEITLEMASNPEFLRQGSAVKDTMQADRIVIGTDKEEVASIIEKMYSPLQVPILKTTIKSAEMIKYASNAFLATKISFINEIANLCEAVDADVMAVSQGMGMDNRIGEAFLQPGIGYGGSCFPKDVKALLHTAKLNGMDFALLQDTININENQQKRLVTKALQRFGNLKGKKIALLGLSFKPETDDMREAPSIKIAQLLNNHGAKVFAYDPVASSNAKKVIGDTIYYVDSVKDAIQKADALFIVTEWKEFKELDLVKVTSSMKQPIIFDGRNCFEENQIKACKKIEYYPIGKPETIL